MEIKLLNYSIFITESELKKIGSENFKLIKGISESKNNVDIKKDLNSITFNSLQRSIKRKAINLSYINKKNAANDIVLKFCNNMPENEKDLYSAIITSEIAIQNTEMFIDVVFNVLKKVDVKLFHYIVKRVEIMKNKISNNEEINEMDIKFNRWLNKLVCTIINKYYQGIDIETVIAKLTTTYLFEGELLTKKFK